MKIEGSLSILWNEDGQHIDCIWDPRDGVGCQKQSKQIARKTFKDSLARFWQTLRDCYDAVSSSDSLGAKVKFATAIRDIQSVLIPSHFNFDAIPGGVISVKVLPDTIPIETFDVQGKPLCIRNILIHKKVLSTALVVPESVDQRRSHRYSSSEPDSYYAFTWNCPLATGDEIREHRETIHDYLRKLYGPKRVYYRNDLSEASELNAAELENALAKGALGSFYFFGHGVRGRVGSLQLDTDRLDAERLDRWLKKNPTTDRGLAFLNACWTGGLDTVAGMDIARVLCSHGWQAVIGTVGPPLGYQAARFAERFFQSLYRPDIVRAFRLAQRWAWRIYQDSSRQNEVPDFTWAIYRLYVSLEDRYIRTPCTRNGSLFIRPKNQPQLKVEFAEEVSVEPHKRKALSSRVIQDFVTHFGGEPPNLEQVFRWAIKDPQRTQIADQIVEKALGSLGERWTKEMFDRDLCLLLEGVYERISPNKLDLENLASVLLLLPADNENRTGQAQAPPSVVVAPELTRFIVGLFRKQVRPGPLVRDNVYEIADEVVQSIRKRLFGPNGRVKWDQLNKPAQAVLQEVAAVAQDSKTVRPEHLLKGIILYALKMVDQRSQVEADLTVGKDLREKLVRIQSERRGNRQLELSADRFDNASLHVLHHCIVTRLKGLAANEGDFHYQLFDSLYTVFPRVNMSKQDHDLLTSFLPVMDELRPFHRFGEHVPRVIREIAEVPVRSPGISIAGDAVQRAYAGVLEAMEQAKSEPTRVPVIRSVSTLTVEAILMEFPKFYRRHANVHYDVFIVWLRWERAALHRHILDAHFGLLQKLLGGPAQKLGATVLEELRDAAPKILFCFSLGNIDMSSMAGDDPRLKAFRTFLPMIRSQHIPAIVTVGDDLSVAKKIVHQYPFYQVAPGTPCTDCVKDLLHHHMRHWVSMRGGSEYHVNREDIWLEKLIERECPQEDVTDLFGKVGETAWNALEKCPTIPRGDSIWKTIYSQTASLETGDASFQ